MVNSKKIGKSTVAVILLSILLTLSLILTATGAWFTDKSEGDEKTYTFGTVKMNVTATEFGEVTRDSSVTYVKDIMPGDSIKYNLSVAKVDGSEDFWFIVSIKVEGNAGTSLSITPTENDVKDSTKDLGSFGGTLTLTGETYDDNYKGQTVKLSYAVYAIQKANMTKDNAWSALSAKLV